MLTISCKSDSFTNRLRDRLHVTGVTLGLLRLQLETGRTEDARTTMAAIQQDFQLLLHGLDGECSSSEPEQSRKNSVRSRKRARPKGKKMAHSLDYFASTIHDRHGEVCEI